MTVIVSIRPKWRKTETMSIFQIVADCDLCGDGKVPYEPPEVTSCNSCGEEFTCHPDGRMIPLEET